MGWKPSFDDEGNPYYYNKALNRSQYEMPSDVNSPPLPPPPRPSKLPAGPSRQHASADLQADKNQLQTPPSLRIEKRLIKRKLDAMNAAQMHEPSAVRAMLISDAKNDLCDIEILCEKKRRNYLF